MGGSVCLAEFTACCKLCFSIFLVLAAHVIMCSSSEHTICCIAVSIACCQTFYCLMSEAARLACASLGIICFTLSLFLLSSIIPVDRRPRLLLWTYSCITFIICSVHCVWLIFTMLVRHGHRSDGTILFLAFSLSFFSINSITREPLRLVWWNVALTWSLNM